MEVRAISRRVLMEKVRWGGLKTPRTRICRKEGRYLRAGYRGSSCAGWHGAKLEFTGTPVRRPTPLKPGERANCQRDAPTGRRHVRVGRP